VSSVSSRADADALVVVSLFTSSLSEHGLAFVNDEVARAKALDKSFSTSVSLIYSSSAPGHRLVLAPIANISRDYDDVRRYADATAAGMKRALAAGAKTIALYVESPDTSSLPQPDLFQKARLVALLSALAVGYLPLECRESGIALSLVELVVVGSDDAIGEAHIAQAIEHGRAVARDIGGSDPERMAAPNVAKYVDALFKNTDISVRIESDIPSLKKEYPLLAAVSRCADVVPRHRPAVIHLEYTPKGEVKETLIFVGKGITYDTGGADIKAGGVMAVMHRDKCGAAMVCGLFQTLLHIKPEHVRVVGLLAMVRNSVGADCYVGDEIIVSRAGTRVRVVNTDAEGRMVMADLLCLAKEKALSSVNPRLFTVATLTGHAVRAYGEGYSIVMDNGPARKANVHKRLSESGSLIGDPFEVSTVRREDYDFVASKYPTEDVVQCNNLPSTGTARGHQFPAAFLARASGLDRHGLDSTTPIAYSHLDIAGSTHAWPNPVTAAPLPALVSAFFL